MGNIIAAMQRGGFGVVLVKSVPLITHPEYGDFVSWEAAIIACIEVATEQ